MQWIVDHWFELATTALLAVIAINTIDRKWNNSTIVEQLNDVIRSFSPLANRDAAAVRDRSSSALGRPQ
jgi:hypothetical protein